MHLYFYVISHENGDFQKHFLNRRNLRTHLYFYVIGYENRVFKREEFENAAFFAFVCTENILRFSKTMAPRCDSLSEFSSNINPK